MPCHNDDVDDDPTASIATTATQDNDDEVSAASL